ncbi:hypothetical protein CN918_26515 [Priestia megaterium]|nr:hypothetical protein CN918_26515 [Priestia megaterium]
MKKIVGISLLACGLLLAGCENETTQETVKKEEVKNEVVKKKDAGTAEQEEVAANEDAEGTADGLTAEERKEGFEYDPSFGAAKYYGFGYNDEVGIDGTDSDLKPIKMGPISMTIKNVSVLDVIPNDETRDMFGGNDRVRAVSISMKVENTSDEDVTFYPSETIAVTDTGEQVETSDELTGDVGGDFLGKVKREGDVVFLLKDPKADIKSIKFIFDGPADKDMYEISGEKRLTFDILSVEEAKKKDAGK